MVYKFIRGRIVGIPNLELTPEDAANIGGALGSWFKPGSVAITGRDYYASSRMIKRALTSGLMSAGVEVLDLHASTIGEISFSMKRFGARGGVSITYYPVHKDHVQVRVFSSPGVELVGDELLNVVKGGCRRVKPREVGWLSYAEYIHQIYVSALIAFINADLVGSRRFNIAISTSHGPSDLILPELLSQLHVDVIVLNSSRSVPQGYEYPLIEEVNKVSEVTQAAGLDFGAVISNDGSSISIVDGSGRVLLTEEVAAALKPLIQVNSSIITSSDVFNTIEEELSDLGVSIRRAGILEGAVLKESSKVRPFIGFTSVGEFVHPLFSLGYDAILTLLRIMESLATSDKKLSELINKYSVKGYLEYIIGDNVINVKNSICMEEAYCRSMIGGYRLRIDNVNVALLHDALSSGTRVIVEKIQGYEEVVRKIKSLLK
ncbi:MAG: hypothetical protein QXN38_03455 [Desulfurococcaceae archaeon]